MRAVGFTEQPRLTLQRAEERRQIAIDERAHDLFHDKRVPQSGPCGVREVERSLFNQVLDEGDAVRASIDVFADVGIERDGSLQQD